MKAVANKKPRYISSGSSRRPDFSGLSIEVKNLYHRTIVSPLEIKKDINKILKALNVYGAELSLLLVDKAMMRRLNRKYRGRDSTTDVLSFDLKPKGAKVRRCLSGDIVVSLDDARSCAAALHISLQEELYRYIIHGILHLLDYDDTTWLKKKRMWKRQEVLLKKIMRLEHRAKGIGKTLSPTPLALSKKYYPSRIRRENLYRYFPRHASGLIL